MTCALLQYVKASDLTFSEVRYRADERMPVHAHSEAQITLVLGGVLEERVGRQCMRPGPISVGVKPAGVEHSNHFGATGAHMLSLGIGPMFFKELDMRGTPLRKWGWQQGGPAVPLLIRMFRAARGCSCRKGTGFEDEVLDLIGTMIRDTRLACSHMKPTWLTKVRDEVRESFVYGVRARMLAAKSGVHPVYLARAFRHHYGESISDYVRRLRVQAAVTLLAQLDLPLAQIAANTGFADQSHLTRTLRSEVAISPAELRAVVSSRAGRFKSF